MPAPPFSKTGVDFVGPVTLKRGHTRKPSYVKAYISLFICLATKAVHLELVSSLSTADFLAAFVDLWQDVVVQLRCLVIMALILLELLYLPIIN